MAKNTVVVLTDQKDFNEKIKSLNLEDLEIIIPENPENAKADVAKANILFANPTMANKYINEAKNIVWMQSTFTGIDSMNEPSLRKDYILTNVRDVYGEVMAEYVFSYILFLNREISENLEQQKQKIWLQRDVKVMHEKTICILGTGSVGKEVAKLAKSFGLHTLGYHHDGNEKTDYFDEIFTEEHLKDCLSRADFVVTVLPKTKDTDNIINTETLSCMKPEAIYLNIGRGNVLNEHDLIEAVKEKKIAKAVLDVFNTEPLPSDSPLWSTENIYVTPHVAAHIVSNKVMEIFAENYKRFAKGEELLYKIDFSRGY